MNIDDFELDELLNTKSAKVEIDPLQGLPSITILSPQHTLLESVVPLLRGKIVSLSMETGSLEFGASIKTLQMYFPDSDQIFIIPISTKEVVLSDSDTILLKELLPTLHVIGHYLQYDLPTLLANFGVSPDPYGDTFIQSRLLQSEEASLKGLVAIWLPEMYSILPFEDAFGVIPKGQEISSVKYSMEDPLCLRYLAESVYLRWELHKKILISEEFDPHLSSYRVELDFLQTAYRCKSRGLRIHEGKFIEIVDAMKVSAETSTAHFVAEVGHPINPNSSKEVAKLLFEELRSTVTGGMIISKDSTPTGLPSLTQEVLERLSNQHPLIPLLMDAKRKTKEFSSARKFPDYFVKERIHPTLEQLSWKGIPRVFTSKPNVITMPKSLRYCILPEPGNVFIHFDLKSAEMYILALLAEESELVVEYYKTGDLHSLVARHIFDIEEVSPEQRSIAKIVGLATCYGSEGKSIASMLKSTTKEANRLSGLFLDRFSNLAHYRNRIIAMAESEGFASSYFGRRRMLPHIQSGAPHLRELGRRQAINFHVSATMGDLYKMMVSRARIDQPEFQYAIGVFDSFLYEFPSWFLSFQVSKFLQDFLEIDIFHFLCDKGIGANWGEASRESYQLFDYEGDDLW